MPPRDPLSSSLSARWAVLATRYGLAASLLGLGFAPVTAIWITIASTAAAAEVGCRLTAPFLAPKTRVAVVVVIKVIILQLLMVGCPPAESIASVVGTAFVITEVARRLTGVPYRLPRLVF